MARSVLSEAVSDGAEQGYASTVFGIEVQKLAGWCVTRVCHSWQTPVSGSDWC